LESPANSPSGVFLARNFGVVPTVSRRSAWRDKFSATHFRRRRLIPSTPSTKIN
jgi:hypothetical protein